MTIAEMREWSNRAVRGVPKDALVVGVVILSSTAAFGLGMLADRELKGQGSDGFWIEDASASTTKALPAAAIEATPPPRIPLVPVGTTIAPTEGMYVASKSGTKYYLPSCSGAKRIKEANRIWFATKEEAEAAGLTPAVNCPGL